MLKVEPPVTIVPPVVSVRTGQDQRPAAGFRQCSRPEMIPVSVSFTPSVLIVPPPAPSVTSFGCGDHVGCQ